MSMYGTRDGGGASGWIINSVSRNPEGLLLLAAGAALLLRSGGGLSSNRDHQSVSRGARQYPESRDKQNDDFGGRVGGAARRAGEYVSETTDKIAETTRSYASSAMDYADDAAQTAVERSRRVSEQVQETADYVVREQPWAVALAGLLAGAAVAAAFPTTRLERRTLGEAGQRMRSAAGHLGEQVMEAGMQATERLSEVAEERGLTSEGLKDAAREVGETFSSAFSGDEERSQDANRPRPSEKTQATGATTKQPTQPQNNQTGSAQSRGPQSNKGSGSSAGGTPSGGRR